MGPSTPGASPLEVAESPRHERGAAMRKVRPEGLVHLANAGGSRVEVPPDAASDLSCQHSRAKGPPPARWAVAFGRGELFS